MHVITLPRNYNMCTFYESRCAQVLETIRIHSLSIREKYLFIENIYVSLVIRENITLLL